MTKLILVRHGESEANQRDIFAGHLDVDLTARGLKQAELTADYILAHHQVDKVYASDLKRAYRTGEAVAREIGVSVIADQNLREIRAGSWDGLTFSELVDRYPKDFSQWKANRANAFCTDGESVKEVAERVYRTLTDIAVREDGKTIVAATHATPVSAMLAMVHPDGLDAIQEIGWVPNASVTVFCYEDGCWRVEQVGEASHLAGLKTVLPSDL